MRCRRRTKPGAGSHGAFRRHRSGSTLRRARRLSGEYATPYPPGIPALAGEKLVTEAIVDYLERLWPTAPSPRAWWTRAWQLPGRIDGRSLRREAACPPSATGGARFQGERCIRANAARAARRRRMDSSRASCRSVRGGNRRAPFVAGGTARRLERATSCCFTASFIPSGYPMLIRRACAFGRHLTNRRYACGPSPPAGGPRSRRTDWASRRPPAR
jgi:hypothetical protein